MEIVQKGEPTGNHKFVVSLRWSTAVDFDLAAGYETRQGKQGLIYYGNRGDLNCFPFIELSPDEGVDEADGDCEETLLVGSIDEMKYVWLFCWDYGQIQTGSDARFADSDAQVTLTEDTGETYAAKLDTVSSGNVCIVATIDNSDPQSLRVDTDSKSGTLKGLKNLSQLLAIVNQ